MTNARRLAGVHGGGTNCPAPLAQLNAEGARGELVVYVSDNESWIGRADRGTATMQEWKRFRARNPRASLVCIDLVPNGTTQAPDGEAVLNVGGFSDAVFDLMAAFVSAGGESNHWIDAISRTEL
jgi:60 kDa SS-A/Ro ribonucleoprotein